MRLINILLFLSIILSSCGEGQTEKYEYSRFAKQITPSGKYVIYDYARYGPMAFSSDIIGTEIFKIDEEFKEGRGKEIKGSLSEWISNDTLLVYNFKSNLNQPKDTLPIKTEYSELCDFIVKNVFYKTNSGGRSIFDFDSIATTNDSILIWTVSEKRGRKILKFPLGATTIKTRSDSIFHVSINNRLTKNMSFVYKNPDGSFSSGLPEVGTTWYDLTPIKRISTSGLNERKIFWEIEK